MRKFLANVVSTIGCWTIDVIDRSYPLFIGLVNLTHRVARTLSTVTSRRWLRLLTD